MQLSHYQTLYDSEVNHWWYKVRRELVHKLLKKNFGVRNNLKILDVGCGTGALMKEISAYGDVYGIDFSEQAVEFCKNRGIQNVEKSLLETIPHPNSTFDLVLALDVLEHIKDDDAGLTEIYRVLKPGGIVIIFVPAFKFLWGVTDVLSEHYRRYTKPELLEKLAQKKFQVLYSSYFNFLLFFPIMISRFVVNTFKLKISSENNTGSGLMNSVLYNVFRMEVFMLKFGRLPFGVSCMVVAKK